MKTIFILLTIFSCKLIAQDTNVVWVKSIDTLNFKLQYNKKFIPKDLYKYLEIKKNEIANPNEPYRAGCIGEKGEPGRRLNWVAKDNQNHLIISISIGGKGHRNSYFFLDKRKEVYNINKITFGNRSKVFSLGQLITLMQRESFEYEEYESK